MTQKFTSKAQSALKHAAGIASELGHTYIGTEHLLFGLSAEREGVAARVLDGAGVHPEKIRDAASRFTGIGHQTFPGAADMTPRLRKLLRESGQLPGASTLGLIGTEHLLLALLRMRDCVAVKLLSSLGVQCDEMRSDLEEILDSTQKEKSKKCNHQIAEICPVLQGFGRDMTAMAAEGRLDPVIGREEEIARVIRVLSRRQKNNPCLVGEPGVGKTAVVEGLADRIVREQVPPPLRGKFIFSLDLSSMIAGAKYRGEFEERMKNMVEQLRTTPEIILFIDEIHTIVGAGAAEGAIDAANILKPAMSRGEIHVIGATTAEEYRKHIEKDAALERRFQPITVEEPSHEQTRAILSGLRDRYEAHHGLKISEDAMDAAILLSERYIPDRYLPDKALDLLDEAAAGLRLQNLEGDKARRSMEKMRRELEEKKEKAVLSQDYEKAGELRDKIANIDVKIEKENVKKESEGSRTVTAERIAMTLSEMTGIPVSTLRAKEKEKLTELEKELSARVIGQSDAIAALCSAIRRSKSGIRDPGRPIGSFLFLGPTGVGKTELAKALAAALFGSDDALIRFDMSEYMEKISVSRLLGSPPGYVGYDEGGQLAKRVRRHPYSVVLFDEIEKAHPDIYNILLQILDDGVLTDSDGRTVSFRNTILILTSNIGAGQEGKGRTLGFSEWAPQDGDGGDAHGMPVLKEYFRPELINRIDEIIGFRRLGKGELEQIAKLLLAETADRLSEQGIAVNFSKEVATYLVNEGYSPAFGARALRRTLSKKIGNRLSEIILEKAPGKEEEIEVTVQDGVPGFNVRKKQAAPIA